MSMYTVYFTNSPAEPDSQDRFCVCYRDNAMWAVFDAMCKCFLHVVVKDSKGETVREYNNTLLMGLKD